MDRGNGDGYRVASDWDLEGQRHNRRVFRSRLRENRAVAVCLALLFVVLGVLVCLVGKTGASRANVGRSRALLDGRGVRAHTLFREGKTQRREANQMQLGRLIVQSV